MSHAEQSKHCGGLAGFETALGVRAYAGSPAQREAKRYVIENCDRPGHYWKAHKKEWASHFDGDFSTYTSRSTAERSARKVSRVYRCHATEYKP